MNVQQFIKKWHKSTLKERSASQSHFNDLCALLGVPTPTDADPDGTWYTFERGAKKTGGGDGWADVWKRGCFAWEYKGREGGVVEHISAAAHRLNELCENWLNPPEWVDWVRTPEEEKAGYPVRPVTIPATRRS